MQIYNKLKIFRVVLLILLPFMVIKAQVDTLYFNGMKDYTNFFTAEYIQKYQQVNFFKYKLITPVTNVYDYHRGDTLDSICDALKYMSLVNDLDVSSFREEEPEINLANLQNKMQRLMLAGSVPFSFSFIKYHDFKDSAILLNTIGFQNNKYRDLSPAWFFPFKERFLFASSAMNQVFEYPVIHFKITDSLIFTNINKDSLLNIQIDFDDENGFIPLTLNADYEITYNTAGTKTITCKLDYRNHAYVSKSTIILQSSASSISSLQSCNETVFSLQPDKLPQPINTSVLGNFVSGEYAVWFGSGNTSQKIRKPYIIAAGFNPFNGKQFLPGLINTEYYSFNLNNITIKVPVSWYWNGEFRGTYYEAYNGIYNERFSPDEFCAFGRNSNGTNYLDRLRDEGYDIIILAFDDGTDNTIDNAALLIELIQQVNIEKFSNGSRIENVVSGYSGGAITSRLALALMESRYKQGIGPHPHTKLWISFEGEQQGANVPLGLQHLVRHQANSAYLAPANNLLKQTADIINQFVCSLTELAMFNKTTDELIRFNAKAGGQATSERNTLLNLLANIPLNSANGYPEFCRKVGVAQGSGIGNNVPYTNQTAFASRLGFDAGTGTAVSAPSTCGGSYTWKMPNWGKENKAYWWSANNNTGKVFEGKGYIDNSFTLLPKICMNVPFVGCVCTGQVDVNAYISLYNTTVAKPTSPANYDDAPASTLSTHLEIHDLSAFPFYNNFLAGNNSYVSKDNKLHGFSTTVSLLDLHDPANNYQPANNFISPENLGLLYRNRDVITNNLVTQPDKRFGFPHLNYPATHYSVTPFDGIYNIGTNNGVDINNNPRPDNQLHVEDPQEFIGDYLARFEVAAEDLYMSNRSIGGTGSNYIAEFEARNKIIAGKNDYNNPTNSIYSVHNYDHYLTADGDFIVNNSSKAILHCGDEIELHPGFEVEQGSELEAYILPYTWSNQMFRTVPWNNKKNFSGLLGEAAVFNTSPISSNPRISKASVIYPNPGSGELHIINYSEDEAFVKISDINGRTVAEEKLTENKSLYFNYLVNGIYLVELIHSNNEKEHFKWVISK